MVQALRYLYDIYRAFISFIFNDMMIFTNVSYGWFMVAIFVFGVLIRNLLMLPKSAPSFKVGKSKGGNEGE